MFAHMFKDAQNLHMDTCKAKAHNTRTTGNKDFQPEIGPVVEEQMSLFACVSLLMDHIGGT